MRSPTNLFATVPKWSAALPLRLFSPMLAVLLGWALLGQAMTGWSMLGLLMVLASVLAVQWTSARPAT